MNKLITIKQLETSVKKIKNYVDENDIEEYADLKNLPKLNNVILDGDMTSEDLGLQEEIKEITNQDIDNIIFG